MADAFLADAFLAGAFFVEVFLEDEAFFFEDALCERLTAATATVAAAAAAAATAPITFPRTAYVSATGTVAVCFSAEPS